MWVRIREVSFPADRIDEVIQNFRDTAVARFEGDGHRGFRLLVDRPNQRALEVSYWTTEESARASFATDLPGATVERTNHYELAIDAG